MFMSMLCLESMGRRVLVGDPLDLFEVCLIFTCGLSDKIWAEMVSGSPCSPPDEAAEPTNRPWFFLIVAGDAKL